MRSHKRRSGQYVEIMVCEDSQQQECEFKSVSILEASGILKDDVDVSRSSTCTYDLID